jgi:hypothetical protein
MAISPRDEQMAALIEIDRGGPVNVLNEYSLGLET